MPSTSVCRNVVPRHFILSCCKCIVVVLSSPKEQQSNKLSYILREFLLRSTYISIEILDVNKVSVHCPAFVSSLGPGGLGVVKEYVTLLAGSVPYSTTIVERVVS